MMTILRKRTQKPPTAGMLKGKIAALGKTSPEVIVGEIIVSPKKGSTTEEWQKYLKTIREKKNLIAVAPEADIEALLLAPNQLLAVITATGGINSHGFKIAREQLAEEGRKHQVVITQVPDINKTFQDGEIIEIVIQKGKNNALITRLSQ